VTENVSEQMDGQPAPPSSCVVNVRSITAEVPYASREALCTWFVCREPLAEVLRPFVGDRSQRFSCQKPLAEILHGLEEARCESFSRREPLAEALGPFEAYRGSFEEPLRERPAGRNPRAETLPSLREDASPPSRESLDLLIEAPLELPDGEGSSKASCIDQGNGLGSWRQQRRRGSRAGQRSEERDQVTLLECR
jgi:hypothetical protein